MRYRFYKGFRNIFTIALISLMANQNLAAQETSPYDTLLVPIVVIDGDTMTYRELEMVYVFGKMTEEQKEKYRKWTRLRNAVYVTYPFAKKAGYIFNDINFNLQKIHDKKKRKAYIKSRESELKKEFGDPLTKLSVYQGKVLMKLINRETHNTCYEIIKEYKGGVTANFWQTIAWVFGSSLKQQYNPSGEDEEMEDIVQEVARMYGHG